MTAISANAQSIGLLRIAAILWLILGAVHILAGVMTIKGYPTTAIQGIADAVESSTLVRDYPEAAGAIINQHSFNLLWIGLTTLICAPYIWRRSPTPIFIAALVGGLADIGYFIFLDLGCHVHYMPGTLMTLVSGAAILLSFCAYGKHSGS